MLSDSIVHSLISTCCQLRNFFNILKAAGDVRQLVQGRIGTIADYRKAESQLTSIVEEGGSPREVLDDNTFRRGLFFQDLLKGKIAFHVLWVSGDYKTAEQSFLKINKSGRQLSDWETTLVENRNSSFARAVMSISSGITAPHYWPQMTATDDKTAEQAINEINSGVSYLQTILLRPTMPKKIQKLQLPMVVASIPERPRYIAEILTITEGFRGQMPETDKLLKRNPDATPLEIIEDGRNIISNAVDIFIHLNGPSNNPSSLAIVPALYFYSDAGRWVRGLLYGFIYWMFMGTYDDILARKRLFSAHRGRFEHILRNYKASIIEPVYRKTGSGPEVTEKIARFFHSLLDLSNNFADHEDSQEFRDNLSEVIGNLSNNNKERAAIRSRSFSNTQKNTAILAAVLDTQLSCEICGGLIDPTGSIQHDHVVEHSMGGKTHSQNQRIVHPFCNNNREIIDRLKSGKEFFPQPRYIDPTDPNLPAQLPLFPSSE